MNPLAQPSPPSALASIVQAYGHTINHFFGTQKGYRNTSYFFENDLAQKLNLIIYKQEKGIEDTIKRANKLSNFLADQGMPARRTADPRILEIKTHGSQEQTAQKRYAALYHYLPGHTIPWEAYTMEHLKLLGCAMAQMHQASQEFPSEESSNFVVVQRVVLQQVVVMKKYFSHPGVHNALEKKLDLKVCFDDFLEEIKNFVGAQHVEPLRCQHPLHMDFVRGNVLFDTDNHGKLKISGILDFEKTAWGHPLFDVARTLAFLQVDCCYKTQAKISKYFVHSGYRKRGAGKLPTLFYSKNGIKKDLLTVLSEFFLVSDFCAFLRHTPYQDLLHNHHFVRTTSLLLQKDLLCQVHGKNDWYPKVI